jgi:iron(II)-dependent oxidoreductase
MALAAESSLAEAMAEARDRTLALVAHLSEEQVETQYSPLMSPLCWDLAHIAAYEDLWLAHRHGGLPLLHPGLAEMYDAFETPRDQRGDLPLLDRAGALAYLADVRERVTGLDEDPVLHELVLRHEQQHNETMLQALVLHGLPLPDPGPRPQAAAATLTGLESVEVPGGPCRVGSASEGFDYDNERPAHTVEVPAFRIGEAPVTNATFLSFAEGGGYERREWWSDEGWAWKEEYDITHVVRGRPDALACHVSWFEADAFARAHGARLPTEFEWEKAATWDQDIRLVGEVWEWTSSEFTGYPGFVAHPYREYSEVFFDQGYKVLRGGSWATHPRVASPTFRNWDLPQRRQIFAGVRLAWST